MIHETGALLVTTEERDGSLRLSFWNVRRNADGSWGRDELQTVADLTTNAAGEIEVERSRLADFAALVLPMAVPFREIKYLG